MKLMNGMNKEISWDITTIQQEASQDDGLTSYVTAICDNDTEVSISQHNGGDWDIGLNGDYHSSYDENDGLSAVKAFMSLVQENNK
jgi:hypothetical protein